MKSPNRQKLADKVSKRVQELRRTETEPELDERTGRETINILVGLEKPDAPKAKKEPDREIILYLKEGVNPANSNFTKYPNDMHPMMVDKLRDMSEEVLYIYLWRESWGWGRNYCRTSYKRIFRNTLLGSTKTAQRAIENLLLKKFIIKNLLESTQLDINRQGTLYRILTPEEISSGKTEEGLDLAKIPAEGVVMMPMDMKSTVHDVHRNSDHSSVDNSSIDMVSMDAANPDDKRENNESGNGVYGNNDHPLKEERFKDTLSLREIISGFYKRIGQSRVPKAKREKAEEVIQELQSDGYSLEDIQFAAVWTPENAKEELYDFSIICHTIEQAMAAKKKIEVREQLSRELEQVAELERLEKEQAEAERKEMEAQKARLDADQREELRERALKEIRNTAGIKEDFISEVLIEAKENELLKGEVAG